jgi:hypothetical protein
MSRLSKVLFLPVLFAAGAHASLAFAAQYDWRPQANAFVTSAGAGSPYPNIANHNFGGAGSLAVSSASWIGSGQTAPKGPSEALLRFDGPPITEPALTSISLDLTITKDMSTGGKNVYNKTGHGGYFDVFLLTTTTPWDQGYDAPESANTSSTFGITYNTLHGTS